MVAKLVVSGPLATVPQNDKKELAKTLSAQESLSTMALLVVRLEIHLSGDASRNRGPVLYRG